METDDNWFLTVSLDMKMDKNAPLLSINNQGGEYNNCMPQMVKLFAFADRNIKWTNGKWHLIAIIKSGFALLLILQSKSFENIFFFHFYNELWLKCSLFKRSGLKTGVSCFLSQLLSPTVLMFRRENFCNFHKYFGER